MAKMNDSELEAALTALVEAEAEVLSAYGYDDPQELEDAFDVRPPATPEQIAQCESFLNRPFSPSYRHFLSLCNGLKIADEWFFLGTEDYRTEAAQEAIALIHRVVFDADDIDTSDLPDEVFYPQNFYPLIDGKVPTPPHLQHLKEYADRLDEERVIERPKGRFPVGTCHNPLLPRHTLISFDEGNDCYRFLDMGYQQKDGELAVFDWCGDGGIQHWHPDFYAYLRCWTTPPTGDYLTNWPAANRGKDEA